MEALDAPCVIALRDLRSYQLLNGTSFDFAKTQMRFFEKLRDRGWRWTRYDVTGTEEVFHDGARLYAFVPYVSTSTFGGHPRTRQNFEVALSIDGGETWKFVDIGDPTPERVHLIIPSYAGQPLPPTHNAGAPANQ